MCGTPITVCHDRNFSVGWAVSCETRDRPKCTATVEDWETITAGGTTAPFVADSAANYEEIRTSEALNA